MVADYSCPPVLPFLHIICLFPSIKYFVVVFLLSKAPLKSRDSFTARSGAPCSEELNSAIQNCQLPRSNPAQALNFDPKDCEATLHSTRPKLTSFASQES